MKKAALVALVAALLGVTPVFAAEKPAEASAQTAAPATKSAVKKLTDDTAIRPGLKNKKLVVMDFNATWCGPCRQFAPAFESVAKKYANRAEFISVDIDLCPKTASAFGIEAVPTLIVIYPNGKVKTYVGTGDLLPAEKFEAIVRAGLR